MPADGRWDLTRRLKVTAPDTCLLHYTVYCSVSSGLNTTIHNISIHSSMTCLVMSMRSALALFCVITQRWVVITYGRFGTTYPYNLQRARVPNFLWLLAPWRLHRHVVPKCRCGISPVRCIIFRRAHIGITKCSSDLKWLISNTLSI